MRQTQHFFELPGSDVLALHALKSLEHGDLRQAALAANRSANLSSGENFYRAQSLLAAICAKSGATEAALDCWHKSAISAPQKLKWLETALFFAWQQADNESATRRASQWQTLLENVYIETPSIKVLEKLHKRGWNGKGCVGLQSGKLHGWLWLELSEQIKLRIEASENLSFPIQLKRIGSCVSHILYSLEENLPITSHPWTLHLETASGQKIKGSPLRISPGRLSLSHLQPSSQSAILIPAYDDAHATLACIASVLASLKHNKQKTPIFVAWDNGPDTKLLERLRRLARRGKLILLENACNLGFLASVNNALQFINSENIILLNSDTLVHGNWIDRLTEAAKRPDVATITALSNEAELMSYPAVSDRGKIDKLSQVKILDQAAAKLDADRACMEIPVGVGFCMLITRKALNKIGALDGRQIYRGYGEEVDFCLRAREAGLKNYGLFNIFVGHRGERSFGIAKKALAAQNNLAIHSRFENYRHEYEKFLFKKSGKTLREEISRAALSAIELPSALEIRPWAERILPPWFKDEVCPPRQNGAVLFIRPGAKQKALLRVWTNVPIAEMSFNLPEDLDLLRTAIKDCRFQTAHIFADRPYILELAGKLGLEISRRASFYPLLASLPRYSHTMFVAPPLSLKDWNKLKTYAQSRPGDDFYVFFMSSLWPGALAEPNMHDLSLMPDYQPLAPQAFILPPGSAVDLDAWRYWLDSHKCAGVPIFRMD